MIEFRSVEFTYPNGIRALSELNLSIQKGEFVFLIGPTGSGKSTILKLIYSELKPTAGEVWVNGINVATMPIRKIPYLRRSLGIVFEDFKLLTSRTVFDNVAYALEVLGTNPREIQRRVSRVLHLVALTHKAYHNVEHLSGGEQQRTAIARALVNEPRVLIADEPTGHLDAETGWEIMQIFQKIHQEGTTLFVATHNLDWIERLGKRAIFLYEGESIEKYEKGVSHVGFSNAPVFSS